MAIALLTLCCSLLGWMVAHKQHEERLQESVRVRLGLVVAQAQEKLTEFEAKLSSESAALDSDATDLRRLEAKLRAQFPFLVALEIRGRQGQIINSTLTANNTRERLASGQLALLESALFTGRTEYRLAERFEGASLWQVNLIVPARRGESSSWLGWLDLDSLVKSIFQADKAIWPAGVDISLRSWAPETASGDLGFVEFSRTGLRLSLSAQYAGQVRITESAAEQVLFALLAGLAGLMAGLWARAVWLRGQAAAAFRELEAKMQANAKIATLGEMSTAIAHELNQPLGAIENYAHACERLLMRSSPAQAGVLQALGHIRSEAQRGAEVIRSIRSLARRERGRVERIRVLDLFQKLKPLLNIQAQRNGCEIEIRAEDSLTVLCERTLLEQVIINLTNNGFEAMQDTPRALRRLTLAAQLEPKTQSVMVIVSDNGSGIKDGDANWLFKPFFTTKSEGLGIGLNLCQTIAEQQGGAISWHNKSEQGAEFVLRLPQAKASEAS